MSVVRRRHDWAAALRRFPAARLPIGRRPRADAIGGDVLSDLLNDAPFGFAVLDRDGRYRLVNQRLADVDHVSTDGHLGRRPADLHAGAVDSDCVMHVLRTGSPVTATRAIPDASTGQSRYFLTSGHPVRDRIGRVTAVGAMVLDVTDQEVLRRRAEQLLHFSGLIGGVTSIDSLAQAIARFVSATFRARCAVGEVRGGHLRIVAVQGFTPDVRERWMRDGFDLSDRRPMTAAVRERARVEIPSLAAAAGYPALDAERAETGDASVIAIPLQDPTGELGPAAVLRVSWPYPFQLEPAGWTTLETLVSLSELTLGGIARNAREQAVVIEERVAQETEMLTECRRVAVELLQRASLPAELPVIDGVGLAAVYKPATTFTGVGGDWYDAFALGDRRVGLVIGDVAGHGEEAASFMVQVRNALRAMALEHEQPNVVLERINAVALALRDDNAPFVTCCYAVLDAGARTLTYATAGHFDPLVVAKHGLAHHSFAPPRPPLTVSRHPAYVTTSVDLSDGDRVIMFTDGLIERRGEPIDIGLERLARCAGNLSGEKPDVCVESLVSPVDGHLDDLAVICADLLGRDQ